MSRPDTSHTTRIMQLRARVLTEFHAANPLSQLNGPEANTPASFLTEFKLYRGLPNVIQQPMFTILSGSTAASGSTTGLTQIDLTEIYDAGYGTQAAISGVVDDAFIPIPMASSTFNLFGTNYATSVKWNSNNALVFGNDFSPDIVSISSTTAKSILLGNYDRLCSGLYYEHVTTTSYTMTKLIVKFYDYYTNTVGAPTYTYQIRIIKETHGDETQFVEVSIISSPPSPGYSSNRAVTYPSGLDVSGNPQDSSGRPIDQTKASSYNITNGSTFLNPCGTTFQTASPPAGTSFVFSSDSTGSTWRFSNNSYVNV